jgi:catechol 2,3-dioxygenase-like lactoylglutathione lyase family enzyme
VIPLQSLAMSDKETLPLLGICEVSVYVADLGVAETWYRHVLKMETVGKGDSFCFLRAGDDATLRQRVILFVADRTREQDHPPGHGATGPTHVALGARLEDLNLFRKALRRANVPIEYENTWPSGDQSIYFRDPDGNSLEIYGQGRFERDEQG